MCSCWVVDTGTQLIQQCLSHESLGLSGCLELTRTATGPVPQVLGFFAGISPYHLQITTNVTDEDMCQRFLCELVL